MSNMNFNCTLINYFKIMLFPLEINVKICTYLPITDAHNIYWLCGFREYKQRLHAFLASYFSRKLIRNIVKDVSIEIGGCTIDRQYNEFYNKWLKILNFQST